MEMRFYRRLLLLAGMLLAVGGLFAALFLLCSASFMALQTALTCLLLSGLFLLIRRGL